MALHYKI